MLHSVRVLDCSTGVPGAYCTKLLADAGADVVKVERDEGDPLRRWSAAHAELGDADGALFRFLHTSKRSVLDGDGVDGLLRGCDIVVESGDLDTDAVRDRHPHLVVVSITPYGRTGPYAGRPSTEFTLQAECGSTRARGRPDGPPLHAGGGIGEWIRGNHAAAAARPRPPPRPRAR